MKTLKESIIELITEAYRFETPEEAIEAIKNKKIGVKILDPNIFKILNDKERKEYIELHLNAFYKKCKENNISDPTYGVQFIISHMQNFHELKDIVGSKTIYTYLQNYKKPWVKQLTSYNDFINKPFNISIWNNLESEIQNDLLKHGKATKGSGNNKDVKILYPKDKDGWELRSAFTWQGAKAASFYGKEGENIPAHWCTRASEDQFKHYTNNGKYPLYIIRNYKTGKLIK